MSQAPIIRVSRGVDVGLQFALRKRATVGRGGADVVLRDPKVSRLHLVLDLTPDGVTVADAGSAGGTRLGDKRVTDAVPLSWGDSVQIGETELTMLRPVRVTSTGLPEIVVERDGAEIQRAVLRDAMVLGRGDDASIRVDVPAVSRSHLEFRTEDDGVFVRDAGSSNGTLLNGRRLDGERLLREGDELDLTGTGLTVSLKRAVAVLSATEFRLATEGEDREWSVQVSARGEPTIGAVALAAGRYLGAAAPGGTSLTFYRSDGAILHPADTWADAAIARGERLVLVSEEQPDGPPVVVAPATGSLVVARHPGPIFEIPPHELELPRPPASASVAGRGVAWQIGGGSLGVVAGIVIGAVTGNWLFAIIGAVAGLGAVVFGILGDRSRRGSQLVRFRERVRQSAEQARLAVESQQTMARARSPRPTEWSSIIDAASSALWERRAGDADFAQAALGRGRRAAAVTSAAPVRSEDAPEVDALLDELAAPRMLEDVPVLAPARGVMGIVGTRRAVEELGAAMLLELAMSHAPSVLGLGVISVGADWSWARWLPHATEGSAVQVAHDRLSAERLVSRLVASGERRHRVVLVALGAANVAQELLTGWTDEDGLLIVLAERAQDVPAGAAAIVELTGGTATLRPSHDHAFTPQALPVQDAEELALRLARRIDPHQPRNRATSGGGLLELLETHASGSFEIAEQWRSEHESLLSAALGRDDEGELVELDLERDGPHAMIAGTTGSGKSEVLATLITSLIARYSPERLALFLIDFKGGATMSRFAGAPHVSGIVTDLEADPHLATRAFTSLDAEIVRRKRILGDARVADIAAYRAAGSPGGPLASLVVVIDEFALLVQTQTQAKARLDSVATQGRSLGIHLILATQNPGGVVSAAIRSNTNLWLALRVVGEAESREIIGRPDAARIPIDAPGRAFLRRGAEDRLRSVQVARVTTPIPDAGAVKLMPFADLPPKSRDAARPAELRSELDVVLAGAESAASSLRYSPSRSLWHPPLPTLIGPDDLPEDAPDTPAGLQVSLGLLDALSEQRQDTFHVDLATGNLLITGGAGSGRSNGLLQVAASLAESRSPDDVHLYAIGAAGSLDELAGLPHLGGLARADDREMVGRLLARLGRALESRRSGSPPSPSIVLLVDDYALVREALDADPQTLSVDALTSLMLGGRPVGIHLAVASFAPTDLRVNLLASLVHRVQLRTQDRSDYLGIEWRPSPEELPAGLPGRAMVSGPHEVQLVLADPDRTRQLAAGWRADGRPDLIARMPASVSLDAIQKASSETADVIGIGGAELEPVLLDVAPGSHLLVVGEARSGRSTALLTIARSALARPGGRVVVIAARRGPLDALKGAKGVHGFAEAPEQIDPVLAAIESGGEALLIVDDADDNAGQLAERLERILRSGRDRGVRVVVAARSAEWTRMYEPWARQLAGLRRALVLSDFREFASALDVRLPPAMTPASPGRGFLVTGGNVVHLQVASASS